jgi:3-hydroxy-3-methylglutaryl CoA synthase
LQGQTTTTFFRIEGINNPVVASTTIANMIGAHIFSFFFKSLVQVFLASKSLKAFSLGTGSSTCMVSSELVNDTAIVPFPLLEFSYSN